ncbi:FAD binding domain-containing protein [Sulfitobacter geojensis]|uniref:FAD binding domain-containing protein n=1 Tax=Sulfitobacter geojensis TaxID=1342299 RepID=A0AAE2W1N7_9RHOB|nr:FAD binding domain-containing protein [Sulfitobacter geojensis]MBM1691126.1 FAD binding domain-containing protein [Sulfitobacter geojensis]MBM1695192.1 FAD binding domain-containing protein [Sulfitobacter geojensis]MBM1707292.1 FAD binding domain-containing protein [Sulfitobacter geojensis]MBM1711442.1 FAD binding domain-containing protein [Sulfitobacter geojensis]MBM1715417.1 FAD binding domain-containing protein [Sulfitobacter geojensis]
MKAPAFDYVSVDSVSEAIAMRAAHGEDAIYLAGGHSVVPSLTLRLQAPSILIDISKIAELSGVELIDGWLRIGAMTRHVEVLKHPLIAKHAPLLAAAAPYVAHPAIRNRGTIGGSVALADPASEFPAMMLAIRAELEVVGPEGVRRIAADDFFQDIYETAMAPGEILRSILVPPLKEGTVFAFDELARRRGDYALVGAGLQLVVKEGVVKAADIALFSVGHTPTRARNAQAAVMGKQLDADAIAAAQSALSDDLDLSDEPQMPASIKLHLARVLLGRLLGKLGELT